MLEEMYTWYLTLDFDDPNEGLSQIVPIVVRDIQKMDKKRDRRKLYKASFTSGQTGSVRAFEEAEVIRSQTDARLRTVTTAIAKAMSYAGPLTAYAWIPTAIGGTLPLAGGLISDYAHSGVMDLVEEHHMTDTEAYDLEQLVQRMIRHSLW